ncbi:MAG: F0F1 ATP synthase subunit gamma [Desulfovibrionaceae bacterium]|nr:F0F1 ATP synthase subunit gamma [Desulfovibrionaceae bacterium]MDD4951342.1 F0F1 ATP synthase subunit gamma [Desulfovibrionaceae bacterium]
MQGLESLKKKIGTVRDLLAVVKTMKSLAAVNIRIFENAVAALRHSGRVVDLARQALFRQAGAPAPGAGKGPAVILAVGSDQGMCGQFNETVLEAAAAEARRLGDLGIETLFWSSGERLRFGLEDLGLAPATRFDLPAGLPGVSDRVQELVGALDGLWSAGRARSFSVLHNRPSSRSGYETDRVRVLPLDRAWSEEFRGRPWEGPSLPMLGQTPLEVFGAVLWQYMFLTLFRSFAWSMAAENAARLAAMQAAEKNVLELEEELESRFRETRQGMITSELLDIVSGFEALGGAAD